MIRELPPSSNNKFILSTPRPPITDAAAPTENPVGSTHSSRLPNRPGRRTASFPAANVSSFFDPSQPDPTPRLAINTGPRRGARQAKTTRKKDISSSGRHVPSNAQAETRRMSTMAMASSSLNPNAPLFIPAAYRQVEDFSPEWWELVQTTAWFRDHWFRQHQLHEAQHDAALAALPDDLLDTDDLFYAPDHHLQQYQEPSDADKPAQHVGLKAPARRVIHQPR